MTSICPIRNNRYSNNPVECCEEQCGWWLGRRCSVTRLSEIASRMVCPDNISHEEPDSLELIEEDAGKGVCDYFAEQDGYKCDCHGVLYNDCRQHMMLDLLRRQRLVLERDRG